MSPLEAIRHRSLLWLWVFALFAVPGFLVRFTGVHLEPPVLALIFGIGIVGGAFLLSWAAEVAQMDISASLAIAVLALIAILPEYSIEAVLAWKAGASFDLVTREVTERMELVAANVTGANRLLVGLGWPVVILIFWLKSRNPLDLRGEISLELIVLLLATLVTFSIFFMGQVHLVVAGVLICMYLVYLWISSTHDTEEPELAGPAVTIGSLPTSARRIAVLTMLVYSAVVIVMAAEPFVEALVETGEALNIDEFILIQWIAPLASESPEIIVAALFSLRANPQAGLTTLISAEVNQMTLLIGSMVLIFSLSAGQALNFPLTPGEWQPIGFLLGQDTGSRQPVEFLLTSAVSGFALALMLPRIVGWKTGAVLLGLFVVHLPFVDPEQRRLFTYLYLTLTVVVTAWNWRILRDMVGRLRTRSA